MFDKLWKEATEIPLMSRMKYLTELQRPFGIPDEPNLDVDTAHGVVKIANIVKHAQDEGDAIRELSRQAMIDPQVQMALDYQQMKNERDAAQQQAQELNQQLFEAQSSMAMADQQAQQMGQQMEQAQAELEQEKAMRQDSQNQMIASRDQSLQEMIAAQEQKAQMNQAAETFRTQADQLAQQLKAVAGQPTAPAPAPQMPGGLPSPEELPPVATQDAARQQQEAQNAQREAAIQAEQAVNATQEDLAKQEQMGSQQQMMEQGLPKQGSASVREQFISALQKRASYMKGFIPSTLFHGALPGAIAGGTGGAIQAGEGDRLKGALTGAGVGATLGTVGVGLANIPQAGRRKLLAEAASGDPVAMREIRKNLEMDKLVSESDARRMAKELSEGRVIKYPSPSPDGLMIEEAALPYSSPVGFTVRDKDVDINKMTIGSGVGGPGGSIAGRLLRKREQPEEPELTLSNAKVAGLKCAKCGGMMKVSAMGKCSACGSKHFNRA